MRVSLLCSRVVSPRQACEVIRPVLALLHPECQALENFEALMALCNLAGMSDTVRKRLAFLTLPTLYQVTGLESGSCTLVP